MSQRTRRPYLRNHQYEVHLTRCASRSKQCWVMMLQKGRVWRGRKTPARSTVRSLVGRVRGFDVDGISTGRGLDGRREEEEVVGRAVVARGSLVGRTARIRRRDRVRVCPGQSQSRRGWCCRRETWLLIRVELYVLAFMRKRIGRIT